jgi:hypothetical protein
MTITSSTAPGPASSAVLPAAGVAPADAAAPAGYAELVARLLDDTSAGEPAAETLAGPGTTGVAAADPATDPAADPGAEEAVDPAAEDAVPADAATTADAVPYVSPPPAILLLAAPVAPLSATHGADGPVGGAGADGSVDGVGPTATAGAPATDTDAGTSAGPSVDAPAGQPAGEPPGQSAGQSGIQSGSQAVSQPSAGAVGTAGATPVVLPAGAATPAATTGPPPPVAHVPAVAQVVPEVTRLVSRGNGVHRLTMLLQPEALGEVRVTMTVRDGAVQVHLTGGEDAARALAEGAPELRRVLELAGAGDARVVVRDLAGHQPGGPGLPAAGGSAQEASYGADSDTPSSPGPPGGGTGQQGHHARTRGGAGATDGLTDGAPTLRPDPVTGARQGIDLTM